MTLKHRFDPAIPESVMSADQSYFVLNPHPIVLAETFEEDEFT